MIKIKPTIISVAVVILLSACGGGGGGSASNTPQLNSLSINDILISSSTTIDYSTYGGSGKSYYFRSGLLADLDGDGKNEFVFSVTSYPQVPIPLTVVGDQNSTINLNNKYFPQGAPTVLHSPWIWHADINGDGSKDIIASEAGLDAPPWTGSKIGVAINNNGVFTNSSNSIPENSSRSYAIAIGKFDGSHTTKILLPAQESGCVPGTTMLLSLNNGQVTTSANPISSWVNNDLDKQTSMVTADFNGDGYDDLLITGDWTGKNHVIVYGSQNGLDVSTLNTLPAGPFGQGGYDWFHSGITNPVIPGWPVKLTNTAEVSAISIDVNNDGKPDVFSISTHIIYYPPNTVTDKNTPNYDSILANGGLSMSEDSGYTVLSNTDGRKFVSVTQTNNNLGYKYYFNLIPNDINRDGNMDVIAHYWTNRNKQLWGTSFFINDGHGNFTVIDGTDMFPQLADSNNQVGAIIPVSNTTSGFIGLQLLGSQRTGMYTVSKFTTNQIKKLKIDYKK